MAKLIITRDGAPVHDIALGATRLTLGRHPRNDIVLADPAVSGRHATIEHVDGDAIIEDMGSTNGTYLGGQRIARARLADGDLVALAGFVLRYVGAPAMAAHAPAHEAAAPVASAPPLANIVVQNGANAGKRLLLQKSTTTLGSPGVLVVVIARDADGYRLRHIDGASIALVNGVPLGRAPLLLADGDQLELTGTKMAFHLTSE